MSKKWYITQVLVCVFLLILVICMESFSGIDMWLQNLWFDRTGEDWLIPQAVHQQYRGIFYGGAKRLISIIAGVSAFILVIGLVKQSQRRFIFPCMLLLLSLAVTPAAVGIGKKITNVRCPEELVEFGGEFPYSRVLQCPRTTAGASLAVTGDVTGDVTGKVTGGKREPKPGRCFPAGHASGGFALMALFFCMPKRWAGLGIGLAAGWTMGIYQMIRGEHFLSHTLATMVLAWLLILLLIPVVRRFTAWYLGVRHWPPAGLSL